MAATVGSIQVLFDTNYAAAVRGVRSFASETEKSGKKTEGSLKKVDRGVTGINRSLSRLRGREFRVLSLSALRASNSVDRLRGQLVAVSALAGGFGAAFTIKGISDYSDTYKEIGNRLRIVKSEAQQLSEIETKIFETAQNARAQYESTGILFARLSNSARRLNLEQKDILTVTEAIQKAFLVGGSTPQEASQSAIQLSQGIASNRLSGDELRSVLENPALGQLLADEIVNGDIGKLRELAEAGELTAGVIVRAFKAAAPEVSRLFETTEQTIGQAFIKVDNALLRYIGTSEGASEASNATVIALQALANNFDTVADSLVILAAAGALILGARGFGGIVNATTRASIASVTYRKGLLADAIASKTAADAELLHAQRLRSSAVAQFKMASSVTATASTRKAARKELAASSTALSAATARSTAANAAHAASLKAVSLSGRVAAGSMAALKGSVAFLGGPAGVALIALAGAAYLFQSNASAASEASERYSGALDDLGDTAGGTATKIQNAGYQLGKFSKNTTLAGLQSEIKNTEKDLTSFEAKMTDFLGIDFAIGPHKRALQELGEQFFANEISLEKYIKQTDALAASNPDMSEFISDLQETAKQAVVADSKVFGLQDKLDALDGTTADVDINLRIVPSDITSKLGKDLREQSEELLKDRIKEGKSVTEFQRRFFGEVLEGVKPKKKRKARKTDAEKEFERLGKALAKLDYQIAGVDFTTLNKDTIEAARSAGVAEPKIRLFISALDSGGAIPAELEQIRSRLEKIANIEFQKNIEELRQGGVVSLFSELDQKVVSTASSFGIAEEKIKAFIAATQTGDLSGLPAEIVSIRDELAKLNTLEDISKFADGTADAVGTALTDTLSALRTGDGDISSIMQSAANSVLDLITQLLIVEPLMKSIRGFVGGSFGTAPIGAPTNLLANPLVAHKGRVVGEPGPSRTMPAAAFAGAPKFHSGLGSKEFAAVLERGESVVTANQRRREANTMSRLSNLAGSPQGGGGGTVVNIHNGSGEKVTQNKRSENGVDIVDVMIGEVKKAIGSGKMDSAMGGRFNSKPAVRKIG